jgi:Tol biopolymer transport system component
MEHKHYQSIFIFVLLLCLLGCTDTSNKSILQITTNSKISSTDNIQIRESKPIFSTEKIADNLPGCNNSIRTISPDTKYAVAECSPHGEGEVLVWKIGETEAVKLFIRKEIEGFRADFSPDSKKLLIEIQNGPLWVYDVGQWQTPKMLYSKVPAISASSWSPDSKSIAISYLVEGEALSVIKLDGKINNLVKFTEMHIGDPAYAINMFGPAWSSDSNSIAYVTTGDMYNPSPIQLWSINVETNIKELLYSGKPSEVGYNPSWSPDGKYILVVNSMSRTRIVDSYLFDVKQKTLQIIPELQNRYWGLWSPDSKHIAACDQKGGLYIYSIISNKAQEISSVCGILLWKNNTSILTENYNWDFYLVNIP